MQEGYAKLRRFRNDISRHILDFLFPRRCPFCDEVVGFGDLVCPDCAEDIRYIGEVHCMKCGKPLLRKASEYCKDCQRTGHSFTRGRALYVYGDAVRGSITRFKYHNRREYAEYYGYDMARHLGRFIRDCRPECLIPVPISDAKRAKRGYNQAELIAGQISRCTGIPVNNSMVVRTRDTAPMKELTRTERMKNLKGAFKIAVHDVKYRSVMIVDDIYTTGSTMDAMADMLKAHGVREVYFITLAAGIPV